MAADSTTVFASTLETVEAVRAVWPVELPLWVRISASDWAEGGWNIDESVTLAKRLGRWE